MVTIQINFIDSFTSQRFFLKIVFRFLNGQSYMEAVAKAIQAAKEEIFITDWWLSPEIMLIRPSNDSSMRLDNLLGKRAVCFIDFFLMKFSVEEKNMKILFISSRRKVFEFM